VQLTRQRLVDFELHIPSSELIDVTFPTNQSGTSALRPTLLHTTLELRVSFSSGKTTFCSFKSKLSAGYAWRLAARGPDSLCSACEAVTNCCCVSMRQQASEERGKNHFHMSANVTIEPLIQNQLCLDANYGLEKPRLRLLDRENSLRSFLSPESRDITCVR
jgi:hypothetical protein